MALTKIKEFVNLVNEKNTEGYNLPYLGLNRDKTFIPTVATTEGLENKKYKIVRRGYFVYSGMQTGRDKCIRLGYYTDNHPSLISPAYTTFTVNGEIILPEYFFMFFNSIEKDRYGAFLSDGSIRSNLDWNFFCNIEIELPPLEIQKKYVNIYKVLVNNQKHCEKCLINLKTTCDIYIEKLRREVNQEKIGKYIIRGEKNAKKGINKVLGIGQDGFMKPQKKPNESLSNYKILEKGAIAYAPPLYNILTGAIHLYSENEISVCSPIYETFYCKSEKLLPEYLILWLKRDEFKRYAEFFALGVRNTFDFDLMCEVKIPIPDLKIQHTIAEVFEIYSKIKEINEKLKIKIKDVCPVLIKGAQLEASKINE